MNRVCVALVLIMMIPISVHARSEVEPSSNGDDPDDYLLPEMELEEEPWEVDSDPTYSELLCPDVDLLFDILLEFCLDIEVTDEEIREIFDPWEPDYEPYLFWEDDWYYWEEE